MARASSALSRQKDPEFLRLSLWPMVSLGIVFYFCSYKAQENIKENSFIMVLRGVIVAFFESLWISFVSATVSC